MSARPASKRCQSSQAGGRCECFFLDARCRDFGRKTYAKISFLPQETLVSWELKWRWQKNQRKWDITTSKIASQKAPNNCETSRMMNFQSKPISGFETWNIIEAIQNPSGSLKLKSSCRQWCQKCSSRWLTRKLAGSILQIHQRPAHLGRFTTLSKERVTTGAQEDVEKAASVEEQSWWVGWRTCNLKLSLFRNYSTRLHARIPWIRSQHVSTNGHTNNDYTSE